jgi:trk system potassium uptake protein TrkH
MRVPAARIRRYGAVLAAVGQILMLGAVLMLTPLISLLFRSVEREYFWAFLAPALSLGLGGLLLWRLARPREEVVLRVQEGGVIVLLSWTLLCLASAVPFMVVEKFSFTQAIFESVSGWTTTGLSVVDVAKAPRVILLWRSILQLAGGAGLAIIMLSAIAGPVGPGFSFAEGRTDQLVPHIRRSARLVLLIYAGYAVAGTLAYRVVGMTLFDAVNHSFAAVSTGGFSTRAESIGYWDSAAVESVTLPLMLLGNLNFLTAWYLLRGKLRAVTRNGEVHVMAVLIPLAAALLFALVCRGIYPTLGKSVRVAVFEAVTALTTTGFSTTSYASWNGLGFVVLIVLMLIGGGVCSTAGGIKQYRVHLLAKALWWEIRRPFLPRTAVVQNFIWQGERKEYMQDARIRQAAAFALLYLTTYVVGVGVLTAYGFSLQEGLFEFASALGTVGLSVGVTQAGAPGGVLWTEIAGMFLGRLEFIVVITALIKLWRDGLQTVRSRWA